MNFLDVQLGKLVKFLESIKVEYALIGGIAVSIYGQPRFTCDINMNVIMDRNKLDNFLKNAKKFGFIPMMKNIKSFAKKNGVIPMNFSYRKKVVGKCDIIIAENELEFLTVKRAKTVKVGTVKVKIVTAEDLIIHKISSDRPKDSEDALSIITKQKGKLDEDYIKTWVKAIARHTNNPDLYNWLKKTI